MKKVFLSMVVIVGLFVALAGSALAAWPNGAETVNVENSSTAVSGVAASSNAIAGNVTEITITGKTTTQSWQGYYGNVSGAIELANSAGNVMYNWSAVSPSGEVFASTNNGVDWANIGCFDMAGVAAKEAAFGLQSNDVDGIDETFNGVLANVNVASKDLANCNKTSIYNDAGVGTFDEALLSDGSDLVFASILQKDVTGFDASSHDFEMLVLEDGHGNTDTTQYYFYVELE